MKSSIKIYLVIACSSLLFIIQSCSLDEDVYSIYTTDTFFKNEAQVLASISGIYRDFAGVPDGISLPRMMEMTADQLIIPGRANGWWAASGFVDLMQHRFTSDGFTSFAWSYFFSTVGRTNALLASMEASGMDNLDNFKAEAQALRAYAYFYLMDYYGNVPIFTDAKVDQSNLPEQNTRTEVFNFIIDELEEASGNLPSQANVGSEYYGRITKEAVYTLMALIYLNAEVYTGTAHWDDVITYTDLVINSGAYDLLPDYFDNFSYDNEGNQEAIFSAVYTPNVIGGIGNNVLLKTLPSINGGLFGLPYAPENGFITRESVYNMFEDQDIRKTMFFPYGPMVNPRTGDTVMVESVNEFGTSELYIEGKSTTGPVPYMIVKETGLTSQLMNAGMKWLKLEVDPNTKGGSANNDIAFLRYADVLLMKAEALARKGQFDQALPFINQIRERSNAPELTTITLDDILDERSRELVFELTRRRDLIRFGKYTDAWEYKEESEDHKCLFPIPRTAIEANPKLQQNPGYL